MRKFKKEPLEIEARQFNTVLDVLFLFESGAPVFYMPEKTDDNTTGYQGKALLDRPYAVVRTLEGCMRAEVGDWIIKGVKGEYYPCKPEVFEQSYKEVIDNE